MGMSQSIKNGKCNGSSEGKSFSGRFLGTQSPKKKAGSQVGRRGGKD